MRTPALLATLLLLAGCSDPPADDDHADHPLDADTYAITLADLPVLPVPAGTGFTFNSTITGDVQHASDHIGAHFGNRTTTEPSTAVYNMTCAHTGGTLPGRFQVTCTAPAQPGVHYLRGHARIIDGTVTHHWWSDEATFTVA